MVYPNSTPEFRIYKTLSGNVLFQVRYINEAQQYKSKWQTIPIVTEQEKT